MVARTESLPGLNFRGVTENCNPGERAEPFQVEEYLFGQVKKVLSGKEPEALIAAYEVNLENGSWRCQMPEKIRIGGDFFSVSEQQWIKAAGVILSKAGQDLIELHKESERDLKRILRIVRRGRREKAFPMGIYNLRGELSKSVQRGEFELVVAGTPIKENKRGWQILVRRKSAQ